MPEKPSRSSPVADGHVELLELPHAHDLVLVLVEGVEHLLGLLGREAELVVEEEDRVLLVQASRHPVLDVLVEDRLHLLPAGGRGSP